MPDGRPSHYSPFTRGLLNGLRDFGGEDGILTLDELISDYLESVEPLPRWCEFGRNNPGSTFLFIIKSRRVAPDDVPLPEELSEAESYCRAGGIRNTEKGVQMFRRIVDGLRPQAYSRLDSVLLARSEAEIRSGSPEKACLLYRALFHALYRQEN